jgi:hypothetical protein
VALLHSVIFIQRIPCGILFCRLALPIPFGPRFPSLSGRQQLGHKVDRARSIKTKNIFSKLSLSKIVVKDETSLHRYGIVRWSCPQSGEKQSYFCQTIFAAEPKEAGSTVAQHHVAGIDVITHASSQLQRLGYIE